MISIAMDCRQKADYEDFYVISKSTALEQLHNAEHIVGLVETFLNTKFSD